MVSDRRPRSEFLPPICRRHGLVVLALLVAAVAAGCSTSDSVSQGSSTQPATDSEQSVTVQNQGGDLEGHTPRGFAGSGTGLFAGDELNPRFPADDGVQIWLTFELPDGVEEPTSATLSSAALSISGDPFGTLGDLEAAPVRFDEFGPQVFDLEPVGASSDCPTPQGSDFTCDVTEAALAELADGRLRLQFRLRFEGVSDADGDQDLATFFLTDSNTNEPGIFQLELR